jgi:serine-type D-Ala-D-Ala carboxypeptidase/endopeptidase (penicillin-binding protein 4)
MRVKRLALIPAALAATGLAASGAPAAVRPLPNPDRGQATPAARSATASGIGRSAMCRLAGGQLRRGSSRGGLIILDANSNRVLCRSSSRVRRPLASNMKLFTTSTALTLFGSRARIPTRVFAVGDLNRNGVLRGSLYLKGGGDPALASPAFADRYLHGLGTDLYGLTGKIRAAGIRRVTGRLYADDTIFDRLRGVADSGYATSPYIGPLSGLAFNSGFADSHAHDFSSDPAKLAAAKLAASLRSKGVAIDGRVALGKVPNTGGLLIARVRSPRMSRLVQATDVPSNNFFAEMLMKGIGAHFGSGGTTAAGATVVERFARGHASGVHAVDGSGLTRTNRSSPAEIARLLETMRGESVGDDFVDALAVAGRTGTVAHRMRGTPAAGRCHTKTGTIIAVSNLSGYCFNRSGKVMIFSILMNGAWNLHRAHLAQDRIAALVARY